MNLRASAIVMKNLPATAWGDALLISHAEAMRIGCELEAAADLIAELEALSVSEDKLRALFAGKVLVPVESLTVDWVYANVAMPDTVKGQVMTKMFGHGVYAAIAALQEQGK